MACWDGYENIVLVGHQPPSDRQQIVDRFQACNVDELQFMIGTYRTMGTGLNLTRATNCLLIDLEWTTRPEKQAMGRMHRKGQQYTTQSLRLISESFIETQIRNRQLRRDFINKKAFGLDDDAAKTTPGLTPEELDKLLNDPSSGISDEVEAFVNKRMKDISKLTKGFEVPADDDDIGPDPTVPTTTQASRSGLKSMSLSSKDSTALVEEVDIHEFNPLRDYY